MNKNQVQPKYLDQSLARPLRPSASMSILLKLQKNAVFLELLVAMRSIIVVHSLGDNPRPDLLLEPLQGLVHGTQFHDIDVPFLNRL